MKEFITRSVLQNIKGNPSEGGKGYQMKIWIQSKDWTALELVNIWVKNKSDYSSLYLQRSHEKTTHSIAQFSFSSVAQSCPTLCDPMNRSTPGLPVHHPLPEFTQTHVHRARDAIQPSHPGSSPSLPAPNPSQHQSLFQWVNSSHEVAKVLELQL